MIEKEESHEGRADCKIQLRLQAGNAVPDAEADNCTKRCINGKRRGAAAAAVRVATPLLPLRRLQTQHFTHHCWNHAPMHEDKKGPSEAPSR